MVAKKTTRTLGYILLGLVMIGLVGFGSQNFGGRVHSIGTVGDTPIDANTYAMALQSELRAYQAALGKPLPFAQAQMFGVDRQVLARVVAQTAMDDEAARIGLSVGDAAVRDQVVATQAFAGADGKFSRETYEFVLKQNGLTPAEYEAGLRADLTRGLIQSAIASGVTTAPAYTDTLYGYSRESRDFTWAAMGLDRLETQPADPDADTLEAFHDDHAADYTLPEIRHVTYVWMKPEALLDKIEVSDDDLRALYDQKADEYNQPERRLVERLAFSTTEEAQKAADAIAAGTTDFAKLADERGLQLSDLDLGDVTRDTLGAAGDAVFAMADPGVVGPFASPVGPALYRMNGILDAHHVPFEDVRDELKAEYAGDQARRMISDEMTPLEDELAGGATLEDLAKETDGLDITQAEWSVGDEEGIAAYDEFRAAVANAQVGDYPELALLSDGGMFAVRIDKIDPPRLQALDEVHDQVLADWRKQEGLKLLALQAEALIPGFQNGAQSPSTLGMTEVAETGQTRDGSIDGTPPELIADVFEMQPGGWQVVPDPDNDGVVLVRLDAVQAADQNSDEATRAKAAFASRTAQNIALDIENAFADALEQDLGISLDQNVIDAINRQMQ